MKWWHFLIGLVLLGGGYWVYTYVTAPVPGQEVSDLGRAHVSFEEVEKTTYNSNPPTSGPHLKTWVKPGIYSEPQHEGELIHSLEHGYVVISYNCNIHLKTQNSKLKTTAVNLKTFLRQNVFAHEEYGGESSPSGGQTTDPSGKTGPFTEGRGFYPEGNFPFEASTSAMNESDRCKVLVRNLTELANKKKLWKLVIVPRPQLDTTVALTAWGFIDKFDSFDAKRIERFIDYHRDHGPEKTME